MWGYYRLEDEQISELVSGSKNIENNIYDLACPLIIGDDLPKDLSILYSILEIPVLRFDEIDKYDSKEFKELEKYVRAFSGYLKLNVEIELLEEGELGHTLRVGRYAVELCKLLGISEEETKDIYISAILHDIGKSRIPSKILSKPGKLTEKEFLVMKNHSEYGVEILDDFVSDKILDMILSHHERCDKSGYPRGIVPSIGAKIIGIADSYDAMISNRIYKKNKSLKAAQEELVRCSLDVKNGGKGILYDEGMVRKFVSYHGYNTLSKNYNR